MANTIGPLNPHSPTFVPAQQQKKKKKKNNKKSTWEDTKGNYYANYTIQTSRKVKNKGIKPQKYKLSGGINASSGKRLDTEDLSAIQDGYLQVQERLVNIKSRQDWALQ